MYKPNFFIIGAPKCGTTSLAQWLGEHPEIYMSHVKEPNFFNTDDRWTVTSTLAQYESLFSDAGRQHIARGEASAWYLFSKTAVPNILNYADDPRFIVMVRNPVEMAYSLHQQELYSGNEQVKDFQEAWILQDDREMGRHIPAQAVEPARLQYGAACRVGEHLSRLYELVPRELVLVLMLDDIKRDVRTEYVKVMGFLGVPDDGRTEFPTYNAAKRHRYGLLAAPIAKARRAVLKAKLALGIRGGLGLLNAMSSANTVEQGRSPLTPEMKQTLRDYFADDILLLSRLMERDLDHWLG